MDYPSVSRPAARPQLPSINIVKGPPMAFDPQSPGMPRSPNYMSPSSEFPTPIMIQGKEDDYHQAPPPLPPPKLPFDDPLPHEYRGPRYGSSSAGSRVGSIGDERPHYAQRGLHRDEGYESFGSNNRSLPGFGSFHDNFRPSTDDYCDKFMKSKLNPIRTIDTSSSRRPMLDNRLPRLTMGRPILEEDDRFTQTPTHSAVSPRGLGLFHSFRGDYRSPESDYSPRQRSRRTNSGSFPDDATVSTQGSFDNMHDFDEMDMDDSSTTSMRRLRIDDATGYPGIPQKRRASSPPVDDPALHAPASQSDLFRRREPRSRGSPTPRLVTLSKASLSSHGSMVSSFSTGGASSVTSYTSYGRRSPGAMSPGGMSPIKSEASCSSPFQTPISLNPSPRGSLSRPSHQRNDSRPLVSPRKLTDLAKATTVVNGHKIQDFYMCECCPKKPKKFDSVDELRAHEAEKQYGCSFCGNRFKNKNEAERHQNSLHVRRHSWSCKAMTCYNQAYHESTVRPGEADTCGYCGKDFERTGPADPVNGRMATESDWADRVQHLTDTHKFRECNSSKKFFRADHFRQHLKHSHAGSSGKWTNMLENACMIEEEPPVQR